MLDVRMFDDDLRQVEGDIIQYVYRNGEELPGIVEDKGRSREFELAGVKPKRHIAVTLRDELFLNTLPELGDVLEYKTDRYRITGIKHSPCGTVTEYDCEELEA